MREERRCEHPNEEKDIAEQGTIGRSDEVIPGASEVSRHRELRRDRQDEPGDSDAQRECRIESSGVYLPCRS